MKMQIELRRGWQLGWGVLFTLCWLLYGSMPSQAQTQNPFGEFPAYTYNKDPDFVSSMVWGDMDGDGDLDLAVGGPTDPNNKPNPNRIYRNNGNGNYTVINLSGDDRDTQSIVWGDMDGDGDLDLAAGNKGAPNQLYRNDGNGNFTVLDLPGPVRSTRALAWGDMDGDGKLDLAVGNDDAPNLIYRNQGLGSFAVLTPTQTLSKTVSLTWGDVEGDSDLDLAVGNSVGVNQLYLNSGNGAFTAKDLPGTGKTSSQIAWGDMDNDGDLDLVADAYRLYRNDGNMTFTDSFISRPGGFNLKYMTWGDIDNDGDLDLVFGGPRTDTGIGSNFASLNQGITIAPGQSAQGLTFITLSGIDTKSQSGVLGDMDGDGDLDLAVTEGSVKIYPNEAPSLFRVWQANAIADKHKNIALGDMDNDGDLDVAVGNDQAETQIYINNGAGSFPPPLTLPGGAKEPNTVAWGDMDNDGDLDLVAGTNTATNQLYRNEGNSNFTQLAIGGLGNGANAYALAWGDMDGDGDLDLAVGGNAPNVLYRNDGNANFTKVPLETVSDGAVTRSLAWGDMDGDGDLDLAVGNSVAINGAEPRNQIYRNNGNGSFTMFYLDLPGEARQTTSVAWGDMDGDGDLDLAAGNRYSFSQIYENRDNSFVAHNLEALATINAIAWGDMDGDGDLDLAASNLGTNINRANNLLYRNDGEGDFTPFILQPLMNTHSLAWGDLNGDGALDLVAGDDPLEYNKPATYGKGLTIFFNPMQGGRQLPSNPPALTLPYRLSPTIHIERIIANTFTLKDPERDPVGRVAAFYSLNGGDSWQPAQYTNTITTNLATTPTGVAYNFYWDTFASGFFGQSDNVVLRFVAYPQPAQADAANPYQYPSGVAGSQQRPTASVTTLPLRVRGTQVRVFNNNSGISQPVAEALLYRLPKGQATGALPIADQAGTPYHTDGLGYLQGRGQLNIGDRLVALAPITATESYSLYYMSAAPTLTGLNVYTVTTSGVQTLTVSSANPLLLFNLDVALEWDAREDTAFLDQLKFDLRRTAEFLFDATDGQAALGEITLYHNKENWDRADIRVYASNALIPNADPGGIVTSEVNEIIASNPFINVTTPYSITYQPGRIRIGAVWNRFGEATGTLGEDWPRTLAHELGHYAFYLYDNYLGLKDGVVVPVESCTGTLMTDQYREDFSEFRTVTAWEKDCKQTISAQRTGRADWQTITRFYPWLKMPGAQPNPGPVTLPLAVTQVQSRFATTPTLPLEVAVFDLINPAGAAQVSGPHAQAVLYSQERLLDLGHPVVDKLEARGAHVGDRLCVYDLLEQRLGCEVVAANDNFLMLAERKDWQPEIVVSPVTSRTVSVLVSNVAAELSLKGKLYPENSPATIENTFVLSGSTYATTFQLNTGVLAGHIQIWVEEAASAQTPRRESITSYALGGSPGKLKKPPKGNKRSLELTGQSDSQEATPAIAPDGQVLIYGNVSFADGEFYALQKVNRLPTPPLWTTVVGDGYRILKSAKAPDLVNTSILFRYRGQDVPAGEENFLSLYFWEEAPKQWRKLPTVLNRAVNEASAQAPGPGLYVLMSSLEIPLTTVGWNLVAYPVQERRPVSAAIASLAGRYQTVYGYQSTDVEDPWKVYAPNAPAFVNDLSELTFGQGYWINVTKPVTWLIKGPDQVTVTVQAAAALPLPPATYYGVILPSPGFIPAGGQPVQALIDGAVCGSGVTQAIAGQIVYTLNVNGAGGSCAGAGKQVVFTVGGTPRGSASWQNERVQLVNFGVGTTVYLPEIHK